MKTGDLQTTISAIVDLMLAIPGVRPADAAYLREKGSKLQGFKDGWDRIYVSYEQGWAISATLDVSFMFDAAGENFTVETGMTWPSSTYKLGAARQAATLHAAVVNLAEVIELRYGK